ncbi:MAG: hypothetical protein LBV79_05335 [Candidatus Adiutrix sp.]|jgi:hypothetical protein|nr:hypothetical protein [Candidatus Adiutrix sp.]
MRRFFLLFAAICLTMTAHPSPSAAQTEGDGARPEASAAPAAEPAPLSAPAFTLATLPDDTPEMAAKKAALRLFNGYSLTSRRLTACQAEAPEAKRALQNFENRNGNTLGRALRVVKSLGGITVDVKNVMDSDLERLLAAEPADCPALVEAVKSGAKDLYKGPEYLDDYKLIQSVK